MRASFTSFVVLSAVSSSLAAWVPLSSLQNRVDSPFLDCLETAGFDPVVQGESEYATDAAPFNLRCVYLLAVVARVLRIILTAVHCLHSFDWKPAALVYPNDSAGVAAAVKCGAAHSIKVNARSGGHSCQFLRVGQMRLAHTEPPLHRRCVRPRWRGWSLDCGPQQPPSPFGQR